MSLCKYYFTNFSWNGKKMKKILGPAYYLKLKNIILFLTWGLFFSNGYIRNVISTLPSIVKIEVENDNVVSTSFNDVQFNVEIDNIHLTLLNVVNFNFYVHFNVDLTLRVVATSYQPKNNAKPSLKCFLGIILCEN